MFLQSAVVPIVLYTENDVSADIKEAIGTGFFINSSGAFLTCKHVMDGAYQKGQEKGYKIGVVVKGDKGNSGKSYISAIVEHEDAPNPYDICLGKLNYKLDTRRMVLQPYGVEVWQRVSTYGYPLNAVSGNPTSLNINLRAQKGIVQRILAPGDLPIGPCPSGYELSFLIGTGMSGSPLFIYAGENDILIGICVSCSRTEEIDEITEVAEGQKIFRETKLRITEFGIAHDLISLHSWKPALLGGKTLLESSQSSPVSGIESSSHSSARLS
jgi:hypothetical protein